MNAVHEIQVHFLAGKAAILAVNVVNQPLDKLDCCTRLSSRTAAVDSFLGEMCSGGFLENVCEHESERQGSS